MADTLLTLSNTPVEAWQGLIGALAGGLLTFIAVSRTNQSNRKQLEMQLEHTEKLQRQRTHKERLEELYSLVSQWEIELVRSNMLMSQLIAAKINIQQYTETMKDAKDRVDFNRITMITGIYGDSFQTAFDEVVAARDDAASIIELWMRSVMESKPNQEFAKQFMSKHPRLSVAIDYFKKEIVKAAKEV